MPRAVSARQACRGCDGRTGQAGAVAGPASDLTADNATEAPADHPACSDHPAGHATNHPANCPTDDPASRRDDYTTSETAPGTCRTGVAATGSAHAPARPEGLNGPRGVEVHAAARAAWQCATA